MNAKQLMESAKKLAGEVKEDKRAAEMAFFTPLQTAQMMRQNAQTIEILNKALMLLGQEFAQRAPTQAVEAMMMFEQAMHTSVLESTREAERECFLQLDFALMMRERSETKDEEAPLQKLLDEAVSRLRREFDEGWAAHSVVDKDDAA